MDLNTSPKSEASLKRPNSFSMVGDASSSDLKTQHKVDGDEINIQTSTRPLVDQSSIVVTANTHPTQVTTRRTSMFRGVSRHRRTGRYEAHLWDKEASNATQKKGKQVYIGAYNEEKSAARAYDLAALKCFGTSTQTNFPVTEYEKDLEMMEKKTKEDYLYILRRKIDRFSRGASKYRGVARHHSSGRWEARIGNVLGEKSHYIGTYSTEEEAARAYDAVAIANKGPNVATNFDKSTYTRSMTPGSSSACDVPSHAEDQPLPPTTTSSHHIN